MDSRLKSAHGTEIQGKEVKEQGSLGLGRERNHFALLLLGGLLINVLQVRGLAAKARTVVHDFAIDLAGCEVDKTQDFPQRADIRTSN